MKLKRMSGHLPPATPWPRPPRESGRGSGESICAGYPSRDPRGRVTAEDVRGYAAEAPSGRESSRRSGKGAAGGGRGTAGGAGPDDSPPPHHRPQASGGQAVDGDAHHLQRSGHERRHGDSRDAGKDAFRERHDVGLGFMSFFTKAVVGALKAFPLLNAEIQGEEIVSSSTTTSASPSPPTGSGRSGRPGCGPAQLPRDRDADRHPGRKGAARHPHPGGAAGRHLHHHQRRRVRLAAFHARSSTRRRSASWACTRSRSGRSSWTAGWTSAR